MNKQIFITATDTGVGKTTISYLLAKYLKSIDVKVGYFKPAETGCMPICEDANLLSSITNQDINEIVLFKYKNPVAPYTAEMYEGKKIDIDKIVKHFEFLKKKYQFLIVEGAGGIYVPITKVENKIYTYVDLIKLLNIPVVIVARANLGTINHTVLTFKVLKDAGVDVKAIILNNSSKSPDLAEKTNLEVIKQMIEFEKIYKVPNVDFKNNIPEQIKDIYEDLT